MIGHDQLDAQLARQAGLATAEMPQSTVTISSAPCSHREPPERLGVDAVAFLDPVRDVVARRLGTPASLRQAQRMLVPQTPSTS